MTAQFDFDQVIDRRHSSSTKWEKFGPDVLPFWVADMDFATPDFVLDALRKRLDHPVLGYTDRPASLHEALQEWLQHYYGWEVPEEWIVWLPGVVPALNLAARALEPSARLIVPTPVYYPFLDIGEHARLEMVRVAMAVARSGSGPQGGHFEMDLDAIASATQGAGQRMLLISNPQNPTGRCYNAHELEALADLVDRTGAILVSDEIHCPIILDPDARHIPIAQAHPEIAARTISVFAPTKAYNFPGLACAAAVIPDEDLRVGLLAARAGTVPGIGPLGFVAAEAALRDRGGYLDELRRYLRGNLSEIESVAGARLSPVEATYLAWINVADLGLTDAEAHFARHGLGIAPGEIYGEPDYIRFNFGCPRATLDAGLERLAAILAA